MKILMLRGLQASGKSTFAKLLVDQGWARTNKDDIRSMINNGKWSKENEKQVLHVRDSLIRQYILAGYNVVVDDTNFGTHEEKLKLLAENLGAEFEIKEFNTPIWECLYRDSHREKPVGKKVIWETYNKYIAPSENKKKSSWIQDKTKLKAIICDIDGTVAHMKDRTPYQYDKVKNDYCDVFIKDIVNRYAEDGFEILMVSGRESSCRKETLDWLEDNGIKFKWLFMREEGDNRPDTEVKLEIYKKFIEPYYSVFMCFDDRQKVVEMWRYIGLKCLNVEFGDF